MRLENYTMTTTDMIICGGIGLLLIVLGLLLLADRKHRNNNENNGRI